MSEEVGAVFGGQPKRPYYNVYGERFLLPTDPWSLERYLRRGLTFAPPANPLPKPTVDPADEYVGLTPEPAGTPKSSGHGALDEETILMVVRTMEQAGYSFVKIEDTADTPPESDTKLNVSQVLISKEILQKGIKYGFSILG